MAAMVRRSGAPGELFKQCANLRAPGGAGEVAGEVGGSGWRGAGELQRIVPHLARPGRGQGWFSLSLGAGSGRRWCVLPAATPAACTARRLCSVPGCAAWHAGERVVRGLVVLTSSPTQSSSSSVQRRRCGVHSGGGAFNGETSSRASWMALSRRDRAWLHRH